MPRSLVAVVSASLTAALCAGSASAQVAPPPPPAEEAEPAYIPPPPPEPRPARNVRPTRTPQEVEGQPRTRNPRPMTPPPIPYEPLGSPDLEGNMPQYRTALDLPALKHNPTIPQSAKERIEPVVQARQARLEKRLIENLDLVRELEGGIVSEMLGQGVQGLVTLNTLIAPVVEETSLGIDLFRAGAISDMQYAMNQKIVNEFNRTKREKIQMIQDQEEQLRGFMRMVMEESLVDVFSAHRLLALESRLVMDEALAKSGLSDTAEGEKLVALKLNELPTDEIVRDGLAEEVMSVLRGMETPMHAAFLAAVKETREDSDVSPMIVVDLDIHYKKDMSDKNMIDRVTATRGDEVIKQGSDPKKKREQDKPETSPEG